MLNILFALLLIAGLILLVAKVAKDKGWALPAGLSAFLAGAAYWAETIGAKIGAWF